MNWTKSGTLSVEVGKTAVYGLGTTWLSAGFARSGDILLIGDTLCEVGSFQSDIQLALRSPWQGATASGLSYALIHIGLLPSELALKVSTVLEKTQVTIAQLLAWETATTGTVPLTDPATGATLQVAPLPVLLAQTPVDMNAVRNLLTASTDLAVEKSDVAVAAATSATASAGAASASEEAALASKNAAASSQTSVAALLASFRKYYLGELDADPDADGNGDPLQEGAEYFNSVRDKLRTYVNGAWQDYDQTAQAATNNANLSASAAAVSASAALESKNAAAAAAAAIGNAEANAAASANTATTQAGVATNKAELTAADAAATAADRNQTGIDRASATSSAETATTQAGIAIANASAAATQAGVAAAKALQTNADAQKTAEDRAAVALGATAATTQAGIAATKAGEAAASAETATDAAGVAVAAAASISGGPVTIVNGKTGVVELVAADLELGNVTNTSDEVKPVSTPQATAIATAKSEAISSSAPVSHVGAGGVAHSAAVAGGAAGFLTGADKAKLDGIRGTNTGDQTLESLGAQPVLVSGVSIRTVGGVSVLGEGDIPAGGVSIDRDAYDSRETLRSLDGPDGSYRLVESLGLFRFYSGSSEPDDDETCFATTSGCWLLECPHWDVADAMRMAEESARDDRSEDAELRLIGSEARWPGRVLYGSAGCAITSISQVTQVSFSGAVTGAAMGDRVLATPPGVLSPRVSCYALVSAPDTITICVNNPSAASATLVPGTWKLAVFKEI